MERVDDSIGCLLMKLKCHIDSYQTNDNISNFRNIRNTYCTVQERNRCASSFPIEFVFSVPSVSNYQWERTLYTFAAAAFLAAFNYPITVDSLPKGKNLLPFYDSNIRLFSQVRKHETMDI